MYLCSRAMMSHCISEQIWVSESRQNISIYSFVHVFTQIHKRPRIPHRLFSTPHYCAPEACTDWQYILYMWLYTYIKVLCIHSEAKFSFDASIWFLNNCCFCCPMHPPVYAAYVEVICHRLMINLPISQCAQCVPMCIHLQNCTIERTLYLNGR